MSKIKQSMFTIDAKEFLLDNNIDCMDLAEIGANVLLLCRARIEEDPGTLPNDESLLQKWSRMTSEQWSQHRNGALSGFVLGEDGRWHNDYLQEEAKRISRYCIARSEGARKRWGKCTHDTDTVKKPFKSDARKEKERKEKNTPLPPGGDETARRIVQHYQTVVSPEHSTARGLNNVSKLLAKGIIEADLTRAAEAYAAECQRKGTERRYRIAVGNFYGRDAVYREYLQDPVKTDYATMSPEEIWASLRGMSVDDRNRIAETLSPELKAKVIEVRMREEAAHANS